MPTQPSRTTYRRSYLAVPAVLAFVATLAASLIVTAEAAAQESTLTGPEFMQAASRNIFGPFLDRDGFFRNATNNPAIVNRNNSFFDPALGTNGQACVTCHQPSQGFSVTVPAIRLQFAATQGRDPLFRRNDTADRPDADVSTFQARRRAFQLIQDLGVVRIGKTLPAAATAEFTITAQNTLRFGPQPNPEDPQTDGVETLSLFRRPLATTNTRFDSAVLWDGRQDIHNLRAQVKAAARTLLLGRTASDAQLDNAALFMTSVFTAQDFNFQAGSLSARGAKGGVENLKNLATSPQAPCTPLTDPAQALSTPQVTPLPTACVALDPNAPPPGFSLFNAWADLPRATEFRPGRESIARGQNIFNTRVFQFPLAGSFTCTACHLTSDVGNFPFMFTPRNTDFNASLFVRYGLDSPEFLAHLRSLDGRMESFVRRTADLPVYQLNITQTDLSQCGPAILPNLITGQPILSTLNRSTDPGRAMVTGKCADIGAMKPPILRGLAMRGPYFHNGAAETLEDVVNYYDVLLQAHFTRQERADLEAFLSAL